ncbi:MAG: trypsin-like peptidase domain-containing protein [Rhodanobacter sp.]
MLLGAGLAGLGAAHAATLDPAVLPRIEAATFEVVQAKPTVDPLTYEKPLPLDLLPYQERTDKYHSIGTAFAIGNNRYVTAGHVLLAGVGSLWGPLELRDAKGKVYAIDKIEKFSLRKDFVVFSLASQPDAAVALAIDSKPVANTVVYAVGNALGTGVVIRDGLYTSDTPEQQDGQWKWLRFSAAASPGNSGGPLLDQTGKVIGVVLMKSANENLNYALPISEVLNAPEQVAVIDERAPYQFAVFETTLSNVFKAQFPLPVSLADFNASFLSARNAYAESQLKALLAQESDRLFPRGAGASRLLHSVPSLDSFPRMIVRNSNGDWGLSARLGPRTPLSGNGYIAVGEGAHSLLFHLRKPDSISAQQLYHDPAQLIDLVAKTGFMRRSVGTERVKITGFGKPDQDTIYTDAWQRHWQVRVWPVPYANGLVISFSLPVPDGYATLLQLVPAASANDHLIDMRALTDFVQVAYDGTLAQWRDYLGQTALLPAVLRDIQIKADDGHRFSYASPRLDFSFGPTLQPITANSTLTLGLGYFSDLGKVVWDVGDVRVKADASDPYHVNFQRHVQPSSDLDDVFQSAWRKLVQGQQPLDGVPVSVDGAMRVSAVLPLAAGASPAVRYSVFYSVVGSTPPASVKAGLGQLMKDAHVREH